MGAIAGRGLLVNIVRLLCWHLEGEKGNESRERKVRWTDVMRGKCEMKSRIKVPWTDVMRGRRGLCPHLSQPCRAEML